VKPFLLNQNVLVNTPKKENLNVGEMLLIACWVC